MILPTVEEMVEENKKMWLAIQELQDALYDDRMPRISVPYWEGKGE